MQEPLCDFLQFLLCTSAMCPTKQAKDHQETSWMWCRLTRPWLLSLKRLNSWLEVSNRVLQTSSNHSLRGPPQSNAVEKHQEVDRNSEQWSSNTAVKTSLCGSPSSSWNTTSKFLLQSDTEKFLVAFKDFKGAREEKHKHADANELKWWKKIGWMSTSFYGWLSIIFNQVIKLIHML